MKTIFPQESEHKFYPNYYEERVHYIMEGIFNGNLVLDFQNKERIIRVKNFEDDNPKYEIKKII